jgi:AcrR family transcriptional regulator
MNQPVQNPPAEPAAPAAAGLASPRRGRPPKRKADPALPAGVATEPTEPGRTNDPERTMADILEVATAEFAAKGLAGARIDEIAAATRTSKRMIYYYFESKEKLYVRVLEAAYQRIRRIESELHLDDLAPELALRTLVAFTVDYQRSNPDFIRLVMNENIHQGAFLAQSSTIQALNVPAISAVEKVYRRGVAVGVFRPGLAPVDLHMSISALSVFNVSNRATFSLIFKRDLDAPEWIAARRGSIVEMVVRFVKA